MTLLELFISFGSNRIVQSVSSICGIIGFALTILVTIRTSKISKILKYNATTSQYNKERTAFQKAFEGHRDSITIDGVRSEKLLKDILKNVEEYHVKFSDILPVRDRLVIFLFKRILMKEPQNVNWNTVSNYLAILSGRLSKKEELKNG